MSKGTYVIVACVVLAVVSLVLIVVSLLGLRHTTNRLNEISATNCAAVEQLKAGQRETAQATITGDLAFLAAHPGGTADFPEKVVRQDIADKQRTVKRFAAQPCM